MSPKFKTDDAFLAKLESAVDAAHLRPTTVWDVMTRDVATCRAHETLERCARIMWERACGCVPVVDDEDRPIAMITDRDVCMAAYTQGQVLASMIVSSAMSRQLFSVRLDEALTTAEIVMRRHGVRRLPVVDRRGRLAGLLSFDDIAARARVPTAPGRDGLSAHAIAATVSCIGHVAPKPSP